MSISWCGGRGSAVKSILRKSRTLRQYIGYRNFGKALSTSLKSCMDVRMLCALSREQFAASLFSDGAGDDLRPAPSLGPPAKASWTAFKSGSNAGWRAFRLLSNSPENSNASACCLCRTRWIVMAKCARMSTSSAFSTHWLVSSRSSMEGACRQTVLSQRVLHRETAGDPLETLTIEAT